MNKSLLIVILIILCNFTGCSSINNVNSTIVIENSSISETTSILFFDGNSQFAYVIGTYRDKMYKDLKEYKFNNQTWDYFNGWNDEPYANKLENEVETEAIVIGQEMSFYDQYGEKTLSEVENITCYGRGIDNFTEVHAYFSQNIPAFERSIGINSNVNPFPRECKYCDKSIITDLDNNGKNDEISWCFNQLNQSEFYNYTISITLNNMQYEISNDEGLPVALSDFNLFVMDLNGDGCFEILLYEKNLNKTSSLKVYSIKDNKIDEQFSYILNPGP